jgi:hypothetical protein
MMCDPLGELKSTVAVPDAQVADLTVLLQGKLAHLQEER